MMMVCARNVQTEQFPFIPLPPTAIFAVVDSKQAVMRLTVKFAIREHSQEREVNAKLVLRIRCQPLLEPATVPLVELDISLTS